MTEKTTYAASPHVAALRSVALTVPDLDMAVDFYVRVWGLTPAATEKGAVYLRGTGGSHHILALHRGDCCDIRHIAFHARSAASLHAIAAAAIEQGGGVLMPPSPVTEPGGGSAVTIRDPDGRVFRFVHGDRHHADIVEVPDKPIRLTHVVLNSRDVEATQAFFVKVLGFKLSDRTRAMAFLRCNSDHHSIALGDADRNSLNHIAFLMPILWITVCLRLQLFIARSVGAQAG